MRAESTVSESDNAVVEQNSTETNEIKIPSYVPYLIIGGGTAAMSAFKAIRANDPTAKVISLNQIKIM